MVGEPLILPSFFPLTVLISLETPIPEADFILFFNSVVGGCLAGVFGFRRREYTEGGTLPVGGRAFEGDDFSPGFGGEGVRCLVATLEGVPFRIRAVSSEWLGGERIRGRWKRDTPPSSIHATS